MERMVMLYKREGSADKVYQLEIARASAAGLWDVTFRNARRGQALKKAKEFLGKTLEEATAEFEKQLKAKLRDGYTESQDGQSYTSSEMAGRFSGVLPQLPNPIDEDQARQCVHDDAWAMQEKENGENRMIICLDGAVRGTNKKGLFVDIPEMWATEFRALGNVELAGEHVGETYFVFDLLSVEGQDLRAQPFLHRYRRLEDLVAGMDNVLPSMRLLRAYFTTQEKAAELARLEAERREGAVFKHCFSHYTPGYNDTALKFKFNESSACVVLAQNRQRSVQIGLVGEDGQMVPVGNVTIPPNAAVPEVGEVAEVEYLYYNPGGAFEQPVFLRVRRDMDAEEAVIGQVRRYKPGVLEQQQRERQRA